MNKTFPTRREAEAYVSKLGREGWRIIGAPGTEAWLAVKGSVNMTIEVRKP